MAHMRDAKRGQITSFLKWVSRYLKMKLLASGFLEVIEGHQRSKIAETGLIKNSNKSIQIISQNEALDVNL